MNTSKKTQYCRCDYEGSKYIQFHLQPWLIACVDVKDVWRRHSSPRAIRFVTNYITLDSLLKKRVDLKKVFINDEWTQHRLSDTTIIQEVEKLMFDHSYWEKVAKLVSIYETLYTVLCIVDSKVVLTMLFVYKLIWVMKENLIWLHAREWELQTIKDRWDKILKHPLHAVGN